MAWTPPRTWVAGETVTAAMLNAHVRDNLKAITDPWISYTPTLGGTGWALGNGTSAGKYIRIGNTVHFRAEIVIGSTTSKGSVSPTISAPLSVAQPASQGLILNASLWDKSTSLYFAIAHVDTATWNRFTVYAAASSPSYVAISPATSTAPFTWTTTDVIHISGTYETDAA